MNEHLVDVRQPLAASEYTRIELGQDGVLHVLTGALTLHLDRARCEDLTTTLARAMVALARADAKRSKRALELVRGHASLDVAREAATRDD